MNASRTSRVAAASRRGLAVLLLLPSAMTPAQAQEIEPRAYSATPVGTNFALLAYGNTNGDVVFDDSSTLSDVRADVNTASVGLGRVFDLAGRQSSLMLLLPYQWGDASGNVGEDRRSIERSGMADLRLRFSTFLAGGEALRPRDFAARAKNRPQIGASVVLIVPTGEYSADRLVNISTHRWAAKPEVGLTLPRGAWQFDLHAGIWVFGDNDDFLGSSRRSQDPVLSYHGSISYTLRPGTWLAVGGTYYHGGETSLDGRDDGNRQSNFRIGATLSTALGGGHSLKFTYSDGAIVRVGGDFRTVGIAWQYAWFD
jgi:hypothetical protein